MTISLVCFLLNHSHDATGATSAAQQTAIISKSCQFNLVITCTDNDVNVALMTTSADDNDSNEHRSEALDIMQ